MDLRHSLASLLSIAVIGALGWWAVSAIRGQDRGPQLVPPREAGPLAVEVRTLAPADAVVAVEAYGTLLPAREAELAPEAAGYVVRLHPGWRPGGAVLAGEEILALDPALARLDVRRAEGQRAEAAAALRGAELRAGEIADQLPLFERSVELAARELERLEGLQSIESEARIDAARRAHNAAELDLELARERLGVATVEVEVATARAAQAETAVELAREQLARRVLRAPFDARFTDRPPGAGTHLNPGVVVARLVDVARLHLRLEVPEDELEGLRVGLPAHVRVPARPGLDLAGTVRAVAVRADPALRAVAVEVEVVNAAAEGGDEEGQPGGAGALAAGQFARAEIEVARLPGALVVAPGEYRREDGHLVAHVVTGRAGEEPRLARRELVLGRRVHRGDGSVGRVVLSGLRPGERLAVSPQDRLRDGAACAPREEGAP